MGSYDSELTRDQKDWLHERAAMTRGQWKTHDITDRVCKLLHANSIAADSAQGLFIIGLAFVMASHEMP